MEDGKWEMGSSMMKSTFADVRRAAGITASITDIFCLRRSALTGQRSTPAPAMKYFSILLALSASAFAATDPFAELVRPTEPLTPEQERAAFHLPAGFEIQHVASEPDLRKPMNMQWDATGRLWITESREYPFAIKDGSPGRDTVRIFSDFGKDGRARKVEVFADGLNIPTGLYPFRSASSPGAKPTWKCVVWSIPNIWLMEDTDDDGKADKREVLFGPLGWERDSHGNLSSFRRGDDGWLYGTHGFNNESTLRGRDGSELKIQSGNTWRVRLDGSRVEGHTYGQVNPFGLCWDDRGNLFSADCHSSPIYQLLRGAYYPSFGKPHDGLGFAPQTITHSHGSTAICAPIMVRDTAWPAELQGHMFVGNVQTSRLNHDSIAWHGASSKGTELPDFLSTDDPWFRPVDLSWGPDGALYVADFYNKIIGHYEVPLTHPGRDRERGRLWRIVWRGALQNPALPADAAGLVSELASTNPTRRTLALNELCDRLPAEALAPVQAAAAAPKNAFQNAHTLYALHRLGHLDNARLLAAINSPDALVRTHAVRISRERKPAGEILAAVRALLTDSDAIVARCAAEVLAAAPAVANFRPLLDLLRRTPAEDAHLIHSTRMAIRDQLRAPAVANGVALDGLSATDLKPLLDIMLAVPGETTAELRFALFEKAEVSTDVLAKQLPSMVKNLPTARLDALITLAHKKLGADINAQAAVIQGTLDALAQRGTEPGENLRTWGGEVAKTLLATEDRATGWIATALDGGPAIKSPWAFQERQCADGKAAQVLSSIPGGETLTGIARSPAFPLAGKVSFFLCGHDGTPGQPAGKKNFVRLRDSANNAVLREAAPPRSDIAQRVEWDLAEFAGRSGFIEVTDGDTGAAYAWLAVGRFDPPSLAPTDLSTASRRAAIAADLARALNLTGLAPQLATHFADRKNDAGTRAAAAHALIALDLKGNVAAVGAALASAEESDSFREKLATYLGEIPSPSVCKRITDAMLTASSKLQQSFATALSANRCGTVVLLDAIERGQASLNVLRDKATVDRLLASGDDTEDARLRDLLKKLPPASAEADKLIAARRSAFDPVKANATRGADVFTRNCAACHALEGKGGNIGPQLEGIGGRGADRLCEDILDPNRNVDRAFRLTLVTKKDGSVLSGLLRREEGAQVVLADLAGQEIRVAKSEVASQKETDTSLMPPTFSEVIPPAEFNDLLAYLLARRAAKEPVAQASPPAVPRASR